MRFQTSSVSSNSAAHIRWFRAVLCVLIAIGAARAHAQFLIPVDGDTCTLAQAIGLANYANGIDPTSVGSATTSFGGCAVAFQPTPLPGPYELLVSQTQITLTSIDNYWYGPNALPPIASTITIVPATGTLTLTAAHVGDPTPATANAFRFFYVSGGMELPAGSLTLQGVVLQGGYAKGGDAGPESGGGAGMGGAIFNQGVLSLMEVSLIGNTAQGGSSTSHGNSNGGIGQDGKFDAGGGFGWASPPGAYGGKGGIGTANGGGGGGGFIAGSDGGNGDNPVGGGKGRLGGADPYRLQAPGDGGMGWNEDNVPSEIDGGDFGMGGDDLSGGGVGGGGGSAFGGGGFGGGGYPGGFGGGGVGNSSGGFGAGSGSSSGYGSGGMGAGGAIFNHTGTIHFVNVTATNNSANGGASVDCAACDGSGLGAVLFNLNGNVTIDFSTLAGNSLSRNNGSSGGGGPEDATVYSLAYGNKIQDGSQSIATLTLNSSIIHGTHSDGGAGNDILVNVVDGAQANASSVVYKGKNYVQFSTNLGTVTQTGSSPTQANPLLGALSLYRSSPYPLPVLPIGSNSPAQYAAATCTEADGSTPLTTDARGAARPYQGVCYLGAYQFDGDYIFAANNEPTL